MIIFKRHIIYIFIITFSMSAYAQDNSWRTYQKNRESKRDSVKQKKDSAYTTIKDKQVLQLNDTSRRELDYTKGVGEVTIKQDSKIDSLTKKIGQRPFIDGYTLQIEVSQQKEIIKNARYMFLKYNPDVPLDEKYEQPNTYLFAGRFYDKNSAYEFKHLIRSNFPDAIVIQKKLSLPPLK